MAKELPYFKFEPNLWDNGNIQMCTHEQKGVFVDLISMYWSRLGDLSYKLAVQKICGGNASALDSLRALNIIEVIDGNIYIKFLSVQLDEFDSLRKTNSKNAKEGWEKRRKHKASSGGNASALIPQSDGNAIREEESRGDKKKEDNINLKSSLIDFFFNDFPNSQSFETVVRLLANNNLDPDYINRLKNDLNGALKSFRPFANTSYPSMNEFAKHFKNWYNKNRLAEFQRNSGGGYKKKLLGS